ncbi:Mitochondrial glycoprotein family protein [Quillaja saponaria]|uniref:Mitochondrial glycoprotein family protein n=1 Tax=Quillaja saponaria TaxID=32244 RepID=A0AAD7LRK3_QUISA|nr:Mitochondrial glycoprotein family protein [Quillaja saponaria]
MARLCRSFRKTLIQQLHNNHQQQQLLPSVHSAGKTSTNPQFRRTYVSEMRKSAFEGNILRLLRNEIQYELERSPVNQPMETFGSFILDDRSGEQWIRLKRKFGEDEDIKIEVTMFDGAVPAPKSGGVVGGGTDEDMHLHITFIVNISKGVGGDVLEIMCSAWPDSIEINRLFVRASDNTVAQPYAGPEFKELDDELQDCLYEFLESRGVNDDLAIVLHEYMKNKDRTEFIRWMETVKSFIEKK